jgi:DnaK suppressor protein
MAKRRRPPATRDAELRRILESRQEQLTSAVQHGIRQVVSRTPQRETSTEHEGAESDVQGEIELALIEMKSETLRRVEAALRRLEEGTYGNCGECHGQISEERLRALPFASRCTACEETHETASQRHSPGDRRVYDPSKLDVRD